MSKKAWMNAYTKGSKSLQARLAKVHANNPEFQEFIKQHGMGNTLSVKQSGQQRKSTSLATVQPTTNAHPEKSNLSREAAIKAAAEKIRDRRLAASNRASFGGELGGGFSMPMGGFRTYRESIDESGPYAATVANKRQKDHEELVRRETEDQAEIDKMNTQNAVRAHRDVVRKKMKKSFDYAPKKWVKEAWDESGYKPGEQSLEWKEKVAKEKKAEAMRKAYPRKTSFASGLRNAKRAKVDEDVPYKDASYTMRRGGWVVNRNGKVASIVLPTEDHAKHFIDSTRMTLSAKVGNVIRKKAKEIAKGLGRHSLATESRQNRNRIRSWDSAILPVERDHPLTVAPKGNPPFTPDKPKKNLGVVAGRNDPNYSRARHLARLGLKKAMATEAQDPEVLKLRAAGKHVKARELERKTLAKGKAQEKRNRVNAAVEYIKNPKYSVLDKNTINNLLKGK